MDRALEVLKTATRENPTNPNHFNDLGNVWRVKGETSLAVECFRKALSLEIQNTDALLNLACSLHNVGHSQDAEHLLRTALEVVPNSVLHHFTLGNVLIAQDEVDAAAQSFQTALSLQPSFSIAQDRLIDLIAQGWLPGLDDTTSTNALLSRQQSHAKKSLPADVDPVRPASSEAGKEALSSLHSQNQHMSTNSIHFTAAGENQSYLQQLWQSLASHLGPIVVTVSLVVIVASASCKAVQDFNTIHAAQDMDSEPAQPQISLSVRRTARRRGC